MIVLESSRHSAADLWTPSRNKLKLASKLASDYAGVQELPPILQAQQGVSKKAGAAGGAETAAGARTGGPKLIQGGSAGGAGGMRMITAGGETGSL